MTAYFDAVRTRLDDLVRTGGFNWERAAETEHAFVDDCLRASALPGFPSGCADAIDRAILRYGVDTMPSCAPPADFETDAEHARRLQYLQSELHSIFHDVGSVEGWTDNPVACLNKYTLWVALERLERAAGGPA